MATPELPAGFEIEAPEAAPAPQAAALPPGFELEQPQTAPSLGEQANQMEREQTELQDKYGGPGQQAIASVESLGRGIYGPLATAYERMPAPDTSTFSGSLAHSLLMGLSPGAATLKQMIGGVPAEDIRGREEANPVTSATGTIAGLMVPGGQGSALSKAGEKFIEKPLTNLVGEGILAGITKGAARLGAENALFQSGDELSKMIEQDPKQTAGTAITNVGLAGLFGAGIGTLTGGISPLWKATAGPRVDQFMSDFKGRMNEHLTNPDRLGTFTEELSNYYNAIKSAANEVFGATGLKAREIEKLVPKVESSGLKAVPQDLSNNSIRTIADQYAEDMGLPTLKHGQPHAEVDTDRATAIAQAFDKMQHDPTNPEVQKAYQALIGETMQQFQYMKRAGLKIEAIKPGMDNPYKTSKDLFNDIRDNKHMWFYPTDQGFGTESKITDHPLLTPTNEMLDGKPLVANDVFRIVHDFFGHAKEGLSFGPKGEENAWLNHMQMFSPEARRALTTETRGQNSWVNFGPHGVENRANPAKTVYADQKAGLLPLWAQDTGPTKGQLYHYSVVKGLKVIDPAQQGTGSAGLESKRPNRIPRAYYYDTLTNHEPVVTQNAKEMYKVKSPGKILDLNSAKGKAVAKAAQNEYGITEPDRLEEAIKSAGFNGYKNSGGSNPNIVAVFKPIKTGESAAAKLVKALPGKVAKQAVDTGTQQVINEASQQPEVGEAVSGMAAKVGLGDYIKTPMKKITEQTEMLNGAAEKTIADMQAQQVPARYINKFTKDFSDFQSAVTDPHATPVTVFNAAQDFKQALQGYSKGAYGPFAVPAYHEAYDFINMTKGLAKQVREALEDKSVWGKAAERQQAINGAFKEYLPALRDFEKKFTEEVNGERVISPGKASTYFNQVGNPKAEIKQQMLKNFIDSSEKYKDVIGQTHANLGIANPIPSTSMNMINNTLGAQSHGSKLADLFVSKFGDVAGKSVASAIGGGVGHAVSHIPGAGWLGALIGEHALGPFFSKLLPAIAKPIMDMEPNGTGLKETSGYGANVVRGAKMIDTSIKNIFEKGSKEVIPEMRQPDEMNRHKIDAAVNSFRTNPHEMIPGDTELGHYLPDHVVAVSETAHGILSYLNSVKPQSAKLSPLDKPLPVPADAQAKYERVLDIAQQPLVTLDSIKSGMLTSDDVIAFQSMYPELYQGVKEKLFTQVVEMGQKNEELPFQTEQSLSLFLQTPLDSVLLPEFILSAQPTQPANTPVQPQQAPGRKLSQGAASSMMKTAKTAQTPVQNAQAMASTQKA